MFALSESVLDTSQLGRGLESPRIGAAIVFEGRVRDHDQGRGVNGLTYRAYAELALAEGSRIIAEARERFAIEQIACVHRTGELAPGEVSVWVGVTAAHRDAAFAACRYVIDEVKARVPIWKREHYAEGTSEWLHPEATE